MKKSSKNIVAVEKPSITVGLDVGDRFSYYCMLNEEGEVIEEGHIITEKALCGGSLKAKCGCV